MPLEPESRIIDRYLQGALVACGQQSRDIVVAFRFLKRNGRKCAKVLPSRRPYRLSFRRRSINILSFHEKRLPTRGFDGDPRWH
jgi:hypothetical protein